MKRIQIIILCIALLFTTFSMTACQTENTLTVRLYSGVTAAFYERPFPYVNTDPSLWYQEDMFEFEKRYEKYPRDTIYLRIKNGELWGLEERPSSLDTLMCYRGYFVGHDMGEWGGGVVYYDNTVVDEEGKTQLVAEVVDLDHSFVDFATDRDRYLYEKGYLLTRHYIFLLEEKRTEEGEGPVWTPIVHVEGAQRVITSGAMWDGLLYYTTNQGLFCYVDGTSFSLSALPQIFWDHTTYGMVAMEGKLYLTTDYGIYEYDTETGHERLYSTYCEELAKKK